MAGDDERVRQMTTPYFDGYELHRAFSSVVWCRFSTEIGAGLHHGSRRVSFRFWKCDSIEDCIPGIYAINVTGKLPDHIRSVLNEQGIYIPDNFENWFVLLVVPIGLFLSISTLIPYSLLRRKNVAFSLWNHEFTTVCFLQSMKRLSVKRFWKRLHLEPNGIRSAVCFIYSTIPRLLCMHGVV